MSRDLGDFVKCHVADGSTLSVRALNSIDAHVDHDRPVFRTG